MSEGHQDPDKTELLRGQRTARRRFRPFRALFRLLWLLVFTLLLLFGLILLVSRTAGFRDLLARKVSKAVGVPVEISGSALGPSLDFVLTSVRLPHLLPEAGCEIGEIRFVPDWPRSLERKSLVYSAVQARDITLNVMETRLGTREPLVITRPLGLDTWRNTPRPLQGKLRTKWVTQSAQDEVHTAPTVPAAWQPVSFQMADTALSIRNLTVILHDELGMKQAVFEDLRIEVDPAGTDSESVSKPSRYLVEGKYRILATHLPPQDLRLEWLNEDGTWVLLRLEAERKLVFWVNRVLAGESAGPLVARDDVVPEALDNVEAAAPLVHDISILVGTNVFFRRETENIDPSEVKKILREFLEEEPPLVSPNVN